MRRRLKRLAAFALVPLSAVPIVVAAPQIAPSFEQRVDELRGHAAQTRAEPPTQAHTQFPVRFTTPERRR